MSHKLTKSEIRTLRHALDCYLSAEDISKRDEIARKLRLMEDAAADTDAWEDHDVEIDGRTFIKRRYRMAFSSIAAAAPQRVLGYWVLVDPLAFEPKVWKIHEVVYRTDFPGDDDLNEYAVQPGTVVLFEV